MSYTKLPINPFIVWARNRVKNNKNVLCLVNGATGSGKSYACLRLGRELATELGTNFKIKDNVAFKFSDLLEKMNLPQNQAPGTVFVFEEVGSVGSGAAARQWQSKTNLFFNSFAQTSRHRNQILLMNCPGYYLLEKQTRALIHFQLETMGIDQRKKLCYLKPYITQNNSRTGKTYFKYLRVSCGNKRVKFNRMGVKHPGKRAVDTYEEMKMTFTSQLNQMIIDVDKKQEKATARRKIEPERLQELMDQGFNDKDIAKRLDVTYQSIQQAQKRFNLVKKPKNIGV